MNITTGTVTSASVLVRNDADENKQYDIVATVAVNTIANEFGNSNGNGQIQNGSVSLNGQTLATFDKYNNLSIRYNVDDSEVQSAVLAAVQEFCAGVGAFAEDVTMTANCGNEN